MAKGAYIGVLTELANGAILGDIEVGSIVKLNENGSPVEYLVVHQGLPSSLYDASCDGTWLLRKDLSNDYIEWNSAETNGYANSTIHSYLNNTVLSRFDAAIQSAIKQAKIPYSSQKGSKVYSGSDGLSTKVFALSCYEVGLTQNDQWTISIDGAKLSYFTSGTGDAAKVKRIGYLNGSANYWWLRTPDTSGAYTVFYVTNTGTCSSGNAFGDLYIRPAIIMPNNLAVGPDGLITGATLETWTEEVARKVKKGYIGVYQNAEINTHGLPSGYTEVEYIQSSGTQYINTGFNPDQDSAIEVDVSNWPSSNTASSLFGTRSSSADRYDMIINSSSKHIFYYGGVAAQFSPTPSTDNLITIRIDGTNICIGDSVAIGEVATFTCTKPLFLFAQNNNGAVARYAKAKIHGARLWSGDGTLLRNFVPCTNPSGKVGLYDLVNGVFYENAGTGVFTAGNAVVDVEEGNFAHRIKKAYIGIGGVARPCWSGGELAYYGTITPLSVARQKPVATSVGNYALFGGGYASGYKSTVEAYNDSLIRSKPKALSVGRVDFGATSVGNYALFVGGSSGSTSYLGDVDAYDTSLTHSTLTMLSTAKRYPAATTIGGYALFGGGYNSSSSLSSTVITYDESLTLSTAKALSVARYHLAATSVGDYALFGGGHTTEKSKVVDAYNTSLTRSKPTALSVARFLLVATSVGNYALFGGGYDGNDYIATVDAYDKSLTRTIISSLSAARCDFAATSVGDYALFGGGENDVYESSGNVDAYDQSLTRTLYHLGYSSTYLAATTVGNYALFGGGYDANEDEYNATVAAFTVD